MASSNGEWELGRETLLSKENKFHRLGQDGLLQWREWNLGRETLLAKKISFWCFSFNKQVCFASIFSCSELRYLLSLL
jgi:hypothetical protein